MTEAFQRPVDGMTGFRAAHEPGWRRLADIVALAERKSVKALPDEDLMALPLLYRELLSSLSVAREASLDRSLIGWLEQLAARSYLLIYGVRTGIMARLGEFFARDLPRSVRALWREIAVAALLLAVGTLAGWLLVAQDPGWYQRLMPADLGGGRSFSSSKAELEAVLGGHDRGLLAFSTMLFTHNSKVAILCFALGFLLGIPTILMLVMQGVTTGALFALYASHGLTLELLAWIMIHGTTEILAILLAGGAGIRIGLAALFPGERSRMDSIRAAGRTGGTVMAGVVLMLLLAGVIEGVGRQTITDMGARLIIGGTLLALWLGYFTFGGRSDGAR
ncbi:stage II sporulation protein M [Sandaracinobacter neustonicus]|uniref:Stage II sporulation protein M n=1 Tax=Sandaracinobacter neustonicus TaxID=1715348 RepID=A0A501XV09_9SPHN|nr:stage II sporulation protein M [Sandaracinobacter neustonicus]TPE63937.1 stage II sporulation protein M [Sandaracinobacter neustonicus]